jgi:hypothetical protein
MRNASDKSCRVNQNTFYNQYCFLFANDTVYETKWTKWAEADRPQMIIYYGACALNVGYLKLQTHTQNM